MKQLHTLIAGLLVATAAITSQAQTPAATPPVVYPNKPVKVVVPYPPGGATDIVARIVFQQVSEATGQQFVIENRAGAGGNIGAEAVARAPADGYTLLIATTAHAINMSMFKGLSYDVIKDFTPVTQLTQGPLVLVATPGFPANNVRELIALAKARPDTLNFASSGNGQSTHLSAELFNSMAGIKLSHVPYKGSSPALTDVMAGQVPLMFDTMLTAMPFVKAGKLKALAVTSPQRSPAAPDVPTIAESGLPGLRGLRVERPAGAGRHAEGRDRAAERRAEEGNAAAAGQREVQRAGFRRVVERARAVRRLPAGRSGQVGEDREGVGSDSGLIRSGF